MTATVKLRLGNLFDGPSDLIVLPCSTVGTVTGFVARSLVHHSIPHPREGLRRGAMPRHDYNQCKLPGYCQPNGRSSAMEKLIDWLTEKHHGISLLSFILGALLLLLGVTTGIELPLLKQLAPDASFRLVSLGLGFLFVILAMAMLVYYVPPKRLEVQNCLIQIDTVPLPKQDPASQIFRHGKGPRKFPVDITFPTPYAAPPAVVVALNKIDLQDPVANIQRIEVGASNIKMHGFSLYFATDHESIVYDAVACWIAVGRGA
jgi:H-type lectin domain